MAKSLLEVLRDVSLDPTEQAAYTADPSGYLAQYGYEDVQPDDISEAFGLVADTLPPELAQTVAESQAAGQFGAGVDVGEGDEGLAPTGEAPTFGAGYGADTVPDLDDGLDDGFDDGLGSVDLAFGEGSGGEAEADDSFDDGLDAPAGVDADGTEGDFDADSFGDDATLHETSVDSAADTGEPADPGYDDDSFGDSESGFGDADDGGFDDTFGDVDDVGSF